MSACDAFEVDGTVAPVTVLRLKTDDVGRIEKGMRALLRGSLPFAPVVLDLAQLDEASALDLPLHDLAARMRACQLLPVGAANLPSSAVWNAAAAGMAIVQLSAAPIINKEPPPAEPAAKPVEPAPPAPLPAPSTVTVRQAVRSGQVIYAQGADLVVVGSVNSGAQVIADGHIHIYGPLRGRALAGAKGDADALVFCQSLEAELVSIAGHYLIADQFPAGRRGAPTRLSIENGKFDILPL
jgi:septum site-determining protein MinC